MASLYVYSGVTGNTAHPVTGVAQVCGPDTAYPVSGVTPDDGGTGGTSDPFQNFSIVGLSALSNDVVYIAGRHYVSMSDYTVGSRVAFITEENDISFRQWPGMPPAQLYGCIKVGTSWTLAAANVYTKSIDVGLNIQDVVFDYNQSGNIDAAGRRKSHGFPSASAAAAAAAAGGGAGTKFFWFYDNGTGLLTIGCPTDLDPRTPAGDGVFCVPASWNTIEVGGSILNDQNHGATDIEGIQFLCNGSDLTGASGTRTVYLRSSTGARVANCRFEDSGLHSVGIGDRVINTSISGNAHIGYAPGCIFVAMSSQGTTGGVANKVNGVRVNGDIMYCNSLLDRAGLTVARATSGGGIYFHGIAASSNYVTDAEAINCQVFEYQQPSGADDIVSQYQCSDTQAPSSVLNPETYPVRFRWTNPNIKGINQGTFLPDGGYTSHMAFINARLHMTRFGSLSNGFAFDFSANTGNILFWGCELPVNMNTGRDMGVVRVGANANVRMVNCSAYDFASTGKDPTKKYAIGNYNGGGTISAIGCSFGFRTEAGAGGGGTRYVTFGDAAIGAGSHVFTDNVYFNVGAATWSENASFNADSEWLSTIDTGQINNTTTNSFTNVDGSNLDLTTAAKAIKKLLLIHTTTGVNNRPYNGQYGAWQYGGGSALGGGGAIGKRILLLLED